MSDYLQFIDLNAGIKYEKNKANPLCRVKDMMDKRVEQEAHDMSIFGTPEAIQAYKKEQESLQLLVGKESTGAAFWRQPRIAHSKMIRNVLNSCSPKDSASTKVKYYMSLPHEPVRR